MSAKDHYTINRRVPYAEKDSASHAELVDMPLINDVIRRLGSSGQALFGYFSQLDSLRAISNDVGRTVLAERAARAELHMRILISAGLDALNELHDLGLLQRTLRAVIEKPGDVNGVTLPEAVRKAKEVLIQRYPDQPWDWMESASNLVSDVKVTFSPDGDALGATIVQGSKTTILSLKPESGERTDTAAFFSSGTDRIYTATSVFFVPDPNTEPTVSRSAYDSSIDGLAFAREWVYRHARNAAEGNSPVRTGAGPAVLAVVLLVVGIFLVTVGVVTTYVCEHDKEKWACTWAAILLPIGLALLGAGGGAKSGYADPNAPNSGTSLTFGTNPP
jgi:hypothetical protein